MPDKLGNQINGVRTHHKLPMIGLEIIRYRPSMFQLVERRLIGETYCKRLDGLFHDPRHERNHSSRIHSAAEESSQRHIADEPTSDGLFKQCAQFFGVLFLRERSIRNG